MRNIPIYRAYNLLLYRSLNGVKVRISKKTEAKQVKLEVDLPNNKVIDAEYYFGSDYHYSLHDDEETAFTFEEYLPYFERKYNFTRQDVEDIEFAILRSGITGQDIYSPDLAEILN